MQIGSVVADDPVQFITLAVCFIGIISWLYWGRGRMGYVVSPVLYLLHRIVFYVVLIIDPGLDTNIVAIWAAALALHSVITLTAAAIVMIIIRRRSDKR